MKEPDSYEEFVEQYSDLLDQLVHAGWTPGETYDRFVALYPQVNPDFLHQAIGSGEWIFVGRKEHLLNNVMMAAALWYAVAITHDLEPDPEYTAIHLDPIIVQDLPRLFTTAGVSAERISSIMGRCGAALKALSTYPYIRLDEASYDDFLDNLPEEARNISDDVLSWPPNRMIIEDRLGGGEFSNALLRVGICPPNIEELGLDLTGASVSDRTFRNALGEFLSYCIRYDRKPTVLLYGSWSVARNQFGRVPLLGAVRAKYGSWHKALKLGRRLVNDALNMSSAEAVPARPIEPAASPETSSYRIEDLKAQGIGVVEQTPQNHKDKNQQVWNSLVEVLDNRLRDLPWNQTLRIFYLTPQALAKGDFTPVANILRSPGGYLCEIADSIEFNEKIPNYDVDYLHKHGWFEPSDGILAWSQNFFDASKAAAEIIPAMRWGLDCQNPDYFQSDDPANTAENQFIEPSTGSVPMVTFENIEPSITQISVKDDQKK